MEDSVGYIIIAAIGSAITGVALWLAKKIDWLMIRLFGRDAYDGKPAIRGVVPGAVEDWLREFKKLTSYVRKQTVMIKNQNVMIDNQNKASEFMSENIVKNSETLQTVAEALTSHETLEKFGNRSTNNALIALFKIEEKIAEKLGIDVTEERQAFMEAINPEE